MRKYILLTGIFALFLTSFTKAQVATGYAFTESVGSYTPITGGTVVAASNQLTQVAWDNGTNNGLPIGFNFVYNTVTYNSFSINYDGSIVMGATAIASNKPLSSVTASDNAIAAFGKDIIGSHTIKGDLTNGSPVIQNVSEIGGIQAGVGALIYGTGIPLGTIVTAKSGTTVTMSNPAYLGGTGITCSQFTGEIRYQTIGSAPSRTLIIQWKNARPVTTNNQRVNFQIQLKESDNSIHIVYGDCSFANGTGIPAPGAEVGLRGNALSDFNRRRVASTTDDWNASVAATNTTHTCLIGFNNIPPVSGRTFIWTPPPAGAVDIRMVELVNPTVSCGSASATVTVQLKNDGSFPIDFSINPTTVNVVITGAISTTVTATVSTGTLANGGLLNVNCTAPIVMTTNGSYYFNCSHTTVGDPNAANDNIARGRLISRNSTFPYIETFGGPSISPEYLFQTVNSVSAPIPTWAILFDSDFRITNSSDPSFVLTTNNPGYAVFSSFNYAATSVARMILPCMDFSSLTSPVITISMSQDNNASAKNDYLQFEVSTDGGITWGLLPGAPTCYRYNAAPKHWQDFSACLSAYAGNSTVRLALRGTSAAGVNIGVDQITIENACPTTSSLSATAVGFNTATLNWAALGCGASAFDVEYGPAPAGPYTTLNLGNVNSTNIASLASATNYQFRVRTNCGLDFSPYSAFQPFSTLAAPPVNDNCPGTSLTPTLSCVFTSGTTANATSSSVAAPSCGGNPDDDVWYNFVAPSTTVTITAQSTSTIDIVLTCYQDNSCTTPAQVACIDATSGGATEVLSLTSLVIGNTYYVRVFDKNTAQFGSFNICVTYVPPPPANDKCAGAITLTPGVSCVNMLGTTEFATVSTPASACGGNANDDVWYKFVASSTSVDITAVGAIGFDAVLELLQGSCGTLTSLACANLSSAGGTEVIAQAGLTIGATYFVRVYDYGNGYPANSTFDICVVNQVVVNPPPLNDLCGNAIALTPNATCMPTAGTTLGATNSGLAGNICSGFVANPDDDVWYSFVATSSAHDIIVAATAPLNPVLELRTSACNGALIQCVDGTGTGGTETLSLQGLSIGTTYRIRVFGRGVGTATQGAFDICVVVGTVVAGPANDNCAGAIVLIPGVTCSPTTGTVLNATQSSPSTNCFGTNNDDVWYRFTANQSIHNVNVTGSANFDAVVEVFSGACGASGIACMDITGDGGTEVLTMSGLTTGATYYVRVFDVAASVPASTSFTICITNPVIPSPPVNDNCAGAISIIAGNSCSPYLQNAVGATTSPQTTPTCGGSVNDDVWFKFTAAQTAAIIQATGQGTYDMVLAAYTGTCVSTILLDCINTNGAGQTETLVLGGLTVGQTYFLRVYDFGSGTPANANISICVVNVIPPPIPDNDLCIDAIPLNCGDIAYGQNSNGGTSTGDPTATCGGMTTSGINGIWYRVVGTGDFFRMSTCNGTTFNTKIAVYDGDCSALACLASNDDFAGCGSGLQSQVSWQSVSGVNYFILVGGVAGVQGIFQLKLECFPCLSPTVAGTITTAPTPANSTVNDTYTLSLGGNTGNVINWEFSLNNFGGISNTEPTDGNNDITVINRINGTLYARAKVQNGPGCLVQTTPVIAITPRCASTIVNSPSVVDHYITNVQFHTINKNSTYDASGDNYQDFQALTATVQKGFSYQLKIKTNGAAPLGRVAWIDLNGDGDFSDAGENVLVPQAPVAGTSVHIINIPCTGINGPVRMRVMATDGTPSFNPCDAASYNSGEIEEYTLIITGTGYGNWIGTTNDWCDAANWACNTIPNGSIDVTIPANAAQIELNCDVTCRNISFQAAPPYFNANGINTNGYKLNVKGNWLVAGSANATVKIIDNQLAPGSVEFNGTLGAQSIAGKTTFNNLTINNTSGNVDINTTTRVTAVLKTTAGTLKTNGKLILQSIVGKTALVNPMAGTVIGDVSVERKIGPVSGYHYLSSPVSGAIVNNNITGWRDDFTILSALNGQVFIPGASYSQLATVWEYDETNANPDPQYGWLGATGTSTPITPLKGFACIVPANITVDVLGPLNNGTIPGGYAVTSVTDGLNLIGNPYPSPIGWIAFQGQNSTLLSNSYQAFVSSGGYGGSYGSWNGVTGTNGVSNTIAASQGFFVTATAGGTINATNAVRQTNYSDLNPDFYGTYASVPDLMRMEVQGNGFASEMVIYFDQNESDNYDVNSDATLIYAPGAGVPNVYSFVDNHVLGINVMGALNGVKTVQLGVKTQAAGNYNLILTDASTFAPSVLIYLEDLQTGAYVNLRNQASYAVNLPIGNFQSRFLLHFYPAVTFSTVDETCAGNDGQLSINYPSTGTVNLSIYDANGNLVQTLDSLNGNAFVGNLAAGNYSMVMVLGQAPSTYTTTDYFNISAGNAVVTTVAANTSQIDLLDNSSIIFTATGQNATTFNWNFGDGTLLANGPLNVAHTYTQAGNYTVSFEASNGLCSATSTTEVQVTNTTGLTALSSDKIKVIANNGRLLVKFGNKHDDVCTVEVINLLGEVIVHQENVSMKGTKEFDLYQAAVGQYLVKIQNNKLLFTEKIYLNK